MLLLVTWAEACLRPHGLQARVLPEQRSDWPLSIKCPRSLVLLSFRAESWCLTADMINVPIQASYFREVERRDQKEAPERRGWGFVPWVGGAPALPSQPTSPEGQRQPVDPAMGPPSLRRTPKGALLGCVLLEPHPVMMENLGRLILCLRGCSSGQNAMDWGSEIPHGLLPHAHSLLSRFSQP